MSNRNEDLLRHAYTTTKVDPKGGSEARCDEARYGCRARNGDVLLHLDKRYLCLGLLK